MGGYSPSHTISDQWNKEEVNIGEEPGEMTCGGPLNDSSTYIDIHFFRIQNLIDCILSEMFLWMYGPTAELDSVIGRRLYSVYTVREKEG